jgi:hypothetical protein
MAADRLMRWEEGVTARHHAKVIAKISHRKLFAQGLRLAAEWRDTHPRPPPGAPPWWLLRATLGLHAGAEETPSTAGAGSDDWAASACGRRGRGHAGVTAEAAESVDEAVSLAHAPCAQAVSPARAPHAYAVFFGREDAGRSLRGAIPSFLSDINSPKGEPRAQPVSASKRAAAPSTDAIETVGGDAGAASNGDVAAADDPWALTEQEASGQWSDYLQAQVAYVYAEHAAPSGFAGAAQSGPACSAQTSSARGGGEGAATPPKRGRPAEAAAKRDADRVPGGAGAAAGKRSADIAPGGPQAKAATGKGKRSGDIERQGHSDVDPRECPAKVEPNMTRGRQAAEVAVKRATGMDTGEPQVKVAAGMRSTGIAPAGPQAGAAAAKRATNIASGVPRAASGKRSADIVPAGPPAKAVATEPAGMNPLPKKARKLPPEPPHALRQSTLRLSSRKLEPLHKK